MFRVLVIVVIAAIPVIALGAIAGPEWGLLALGIELGIGVGMLVRRR